MSWTPVLIILMRLRWLLSPLIQAIQATNVIPADCSAAANVRFNDSHSGASLSTWLQAEADKIIAEFGVED